MARVDTYYVPWHAVEPGRDDGLAAALEELLHQDVLHQIQQDPEVQ